MGHRANYAIIQRGSLSLYYSHWGARTVPADVFWGPLNAEFFIRDNPLTEAWLDTIFAEGGIALDKDRRRALFFDDGELLDTPEMQALFLSLAGRVWERDGWTLERGKDIVDMAEFCGLPRASVEPWVPPPAPVSLSELGTNYKEGLVCGLIGHTSSAGFEDRVCDFGLTAVLVNGPAFLAHIAGLPTLAQVRSGARGSQPLNALLESTKARFEDVTPTDLPEDAVWEKQIQAVTIGPRPYEQIDSFAWLNETAKTLEVVEPGDEPNLKLIAEAWPGWNVSLLSGGVREYFRRTGRPVPPELSPEAVEEELPPPPRSREECLAEIEHNVFRADETKKYLLKIARSFSQSAEPGSVIAPSFLDEVPATALAEHDRREIWSHLLAGL